MVYNIIFVEKAKREFSEIDIPTQRHLVQFFENLIECKDLHTLGSPLEENLSSFWKFQFGDCQLLAEIHDDLFVVLVLAVGHRRDIYKKSVERSGG